MESDQDVDIAGTEADDQSVILVEKGKLIGMGYLPGGTQIIEPSAIKDFIKPYKENSFILNLLTSYVVNNPSKVITLQESYDQSAH